MKNKTIIAALMLVIVTIGCESKVEIIPVDTLHSEISDKELFDCYIYNLDKFGHFIDLGLMNEVKFLKAYDKKDLALMIKLNSKTKRLNDSANKYYNLNYK